MNMITRIKTDSREEWLALRKKYIGGSDAAAVVGLNPFSSPYALWAEKTGRMPEFEGNLATEVGTYLEEFVALKFTSETGKKVRRVNMSLINSDYPWAIANVDREVVGEQALLEIKTTDSINLKRYKGGEYPDRYYVQIVHYLAVTGKERCYLAVLIGNKEFKIFTIERDEDEIAALMQAEETFWECVKTDTPPAVDGTASTTDAIKTIFADDTEEETVDLSLHKADLSEYISLGEQIKALESMRDEAANRVKAYMGDAGTGECEGYRVTWRTSERSSFDRKRFMKDNPDLDLGGYYKTSQVRTFRVSEKKGA
jgi:putative phage-type endonuclease